MMSQHVDEKVTKVMTIRPEGVMNECAKCHDSPSNSWWHIFIQNHNGQRHGGARAIRVITTHHLGTMNDSKFWDISQDKWKLWLVGRKNLSNFGYHGYLHLTMWLLEKHKNISQLIEEVPVFIHIQKKKKNNLSLIMRTEVKVLFGTKCLYFFFCYENISKDKWKLQTSSFSENCVSERKRALMGLFFH